MPGSRNVLYIDLDGHSTSTTHSWGAFNALAFSLDSDQATFNHDEQAAIIDIWCRVVEDFAPFDFDVTTVRHLSEAICWLL